MLVENGAASETQERGGPESTRSGVPQTGSLESPRFPMMTVVRVFPDEA